MVLSLRRSVVTPIPSARATSDGESSKGLQGSPEVRGRNFTRQGFWEQRATPEAPERSSAFDDRTFRVLSGLTVRQPTKRDGRETRKLLLFRSGVFRSAQC